MHDLAPGLTRDLILDGQISLIQPARGHRAGTDAVLLAAAVRPVDGKPFVLADLGCGVGTVGLIVARRCPAACVTLVDNDDEIVALAARNVAENGLSERVSVVQADITASADARRAAGLANDSFDVVLANPPFFSEDSGRVSPDRLKRSAHVMASSRAVEGLQIWLRTAAALLKPGGRLAVIHRAEALSALLHGLAGRVGAINVLPVHPRAGQPASRVVVSGTKASRAPLTLLPPLVLHEPDGSFTPRSNALHRGGWL